MRIIAWFLLAAVAAHADGVPISRLAGATFKVADLEKTRQFYTGILGLEEAFDLKDASGAVASAFFKVNDEQYVEFQPASVENFQLMHFSVLTPDLQQAAAELRKRGVEPGAIATSADGNAYFAVKDPEGAEIHFVRFVPGSRQTELRGKALGARRISERLQHIGLPCDHHEADFAFYTEKLGFHELFRGGPNDNEVRWINLAVAGQPPDIFEMMILASQPAQGRRHIAFEVPNMERAHQELAARGLTGPKPNPGPKQNPRWILNLRDPNGIRVEMMGELVKQ